MDTVKRIAIRKGFQIHIEDKKEVQPPQGEISIDEQAVSESSTEISKETLYANIANAEDVKSAESVGSAELYPNDVIVA